MAAITEADLLLVDALFGMSSGYVMSFTNATFDSFFREEVGVDIYDAAYSEFGGSKGKRLRAFLLRGQPAAIVKALTGLWAVREIWLADKEDNVPKALERLNKILSRLGGAPIGSDEPRTQQTQTSLNERPSEAALSELNEEFLALVTMDDERQKRGYAFERFLNKWFGVWNLDPRGAFKIQAEQIDGSFLHRASVYLLEAKWRNTFTGSAELRSFQGLLDERLDGTKGLFVSFSGFSPDAVQTFISKRVIMMDGADILEALQRRLSLDEVMARKHRIAVEERRAYVSVRELFP